MGRRLLRASLVAAAVLAIAGYVAAPYVRGASLIARAANLGGRTEKIAEDLARTVTVEPRHKVPTRYGDVRSESVV